MRIWRRRNYEDWLVPYADGALDARRRAELEARMARDPALAADAEAQRRVAQRLRETATAEDAAPVKASLWPQIEARIRPKRRTVGPLVWAGGACAAACLAWAALSGPLGDSTPSPISPTQPVVATAPVKQSAAVNFSAPRRHHPRQPRMVSKTALRPARPVSADEAMSDSERAADAESESVPVPTVAAETNPPTPRAAIALQGTARFQTAEGIHEKAPDTADAAPTPAPESADNAVAKVTAPTPIPAAGAVSSDAATPSEEMPALSGKHRRRHHRRAHRQGIPSAPEPSASVAPKSLAPPADATAPTEATPKPAPMPVKPVE